MSNKERACNILVTHLMSAQFVARDYLEKVIAKTRYSTTVLKTMGYVNDIKVYHGGRLEYKKNKKTVTHVRLVNAHEFNHETGFLLTAAEKEIRKQKIAEIAMNLAAVDSEVEMCEDSFALDSVSISDTCLMLTDDSESTRHANRVAATLAKHDLAMSDESVIVIAANKRNRTRKSVAA